MEADLVPAPERPPRPHPRVPPRSDILSTVPKNPRSLLAPIWYELWMLNQTAASERRRWPAVEGGDVASHEKVIHNAVLESFLVHFRCLAEFSLGRLLPRDIRLEDFSGVGKVGKVCRNGKHRGKPVLLLKRARALRKYLDRVDKHLAHLTARRTGRKIDWRTNDMALRVNAVMRPFIEEIPETDFPLNHSRDTFLKLLEAKHGEGESAPVSVVSSQTNVGGPQTKIHIKRTPSPIPASRGSA